MSTADPENRPEQIADKATTAADSKRVDVPHRLGDPATPADQAMAGGEAPCGTVSEQLRNQAGQLAAELRVRQEDLDRREARLNARLAEFECDSRTARLWLQERQAELERREAEAGLGDSRAETEDLQQQLHTARRELQEEALRQRQRFEAERRETLADLQRQRDAVRRRSDHVDRSRAALEQLRAELGRMHRETLEVRLATEELWVQLSGAAPPAALTQSLSRVRTKLADHYRQANAELLRQKDELEGIRRQLAAQYQRLVQQKREFEQWADAQREETQQQAARLVARERELQRREVELDNRTRCWQTERLSLQQEIRRLRARCQGSDEVLTGA